MLNNLLKILAVLVVISIITLVSLGMNKKPHVVTTEVMIEAPVEEVFAYVSDFEHNKEWVTGFVSADLKKGEPGAIGSEYKLVMLENGKEVEIREEITDVIPNTLIQLAMKSKSVNGQIDIEFEPVSHFVTQVREIHTMHGKNLLARLGIRMYRNQMAEQKQLMYNQLSENLKY